MDDEHSKRSDLIEALISSELKGTRYSWFRDSGFLFFIVSVFLCVCTILFIVTVGLPEIMCADLRQPLYLSVAIASGVWLSTAVGGVMLTINNAVVMRREANYLSKRAIESLIEYLDEE